MAGHGRRGLTACRAGGGGSRQRPAGARQVSEMGSKGKWRWAEKIHEPPKNHGIEKIMQPKKSCNLKRRKSKSLNDPTPQGRYARDQENPGWLERGCWLPPPLGAGWWGWTWLGSSWKFKAAKKNALKINNARLQHMVCLTPDWELENTNFYQFLEQETSYHSSHPLYGWSRNRINRWGAGSCLGKACRFEKSSWLPGTSSEILNIRKNARSSVWGYPIFVGLLASPRIQ